MLQLELTLDTPAENLALDEALLDSAEAIGEPDEILRLWEPRELMVVAGSSSRLDGEVRLASCRENRIEILRRASGGAAIVTGPGCLMYAVILSYRLRPQLRSIDEAHRFVLETLVETLRPLVPDVSRRGISDLAVADRKFSGNSLRCKRNCLLYHGTLLYNFPLRWIDVCLAQPPRQPAYRAGRAHPEFVTNLPLSAAALRRAVSAAFNVRESCSDWPRDLTARLVRDKYGRAEWNERL